MPSIPREHDRCDVHGRYPSYWEHRAGGCFWCLPWLTPAGKRQTWSMGTGKAASEPSEIDDPDVVQGSF